MKRFTDTGQTQKIYARIDELLMETPDQIVAERKPQNQNQPVETNNRSSTKNLRLNSSTKSLLAKRKKEELNDKKFPNATSRKNLICTIRSLNEKPNLRRKIKAMSKKKIATKDEQKSSSNPNIKISSSQESKVKRHASFDPDSKMDHIKQSANKFQQFSQKYSFFDNKGISPTSQLNPKHIIGNVFDLKSSAQKSNNFIFKQQNQQNIFSSSNNRNTSKTKKPLNFNQKIAQKLLSQKRKQKHPNLLKLGNEQQKKQFCLTHEQLEFLSLLYPKQTPSELMLKLLHYCQQQIIHKNSFQEIVFRQAGAKKQSFFKTNSNFDLMGKLNQKEYQNQSEDGEAMFLKLTPSQIISNGASLDQYTRLKEECLAALGSQIVSTQIKSPLVQTANVNYYTRQYAMPYISELIEQVNYQSKIKLERLRKNGQLQIFDLRYDNKKLSKKQGQISQTFSDPVQSPPLSESNLPEQFIHKVCIPANSRGQCFDMDYQWDEALCNYLPESQYRRILRDVNHLIQKVLLYHRHNSFLKKKNNTICQGWNLALFIILILSLAVLYSKSLFKFEPQTSYLEIVTFFCLSFMIVLILGNTFNNYKKTIKRSSLIKDVCEQITNYLQFINCSNKNIKWVLGKDFFWLEVWIYLVKQHQRK